MTVLRYAPDSQVPRTTRAHRTAFGRLINRSADCFGPPIIEPRTSARKVREKPSRPTGSLRRKPFSAFPLALSGTRLRDGRYQSNPPASTPHQGRRSLPRFPGRRRHHPSSTIRRNPIRLTPHRQYGMPYCRGGRAWWPAKTARQATTPDHPNNTHPNGAEKTPHRTPATQIALATQSSNLAPRPQGSRKTFSQNRATPRETFPTVNPLQHYGTQLRDGRYQSKPAD